MALVTELKFGESIELLHEDTVVIITATEKSGRKVRLKIDAPAKVKISAPKKLAQRTNIE